MKQKMIAMCALVLGLSVFAGAVRAADPELIIRIGHVVQEGTPLDRWGYKFGEILAEKSSGKIAVEVYANSALGGNRELCEQLQLGSLEVCIPSVAFLGGFTDATKILDLPYLFKTNKSAEAVLDGEVGDWIEGELLNQGFISLGWGAQGWRHITANREVHTPKDMAGLKVRVMENPLHISHFNALGASAIPMAFSEVFTALQQGAIDGQENPWSNIFASRFYEVQDYVIKTGHIYDVLPMLYSEVLWNNLTPEQQKLIREAAAESNIYQRELCYSDEDATEKKVRDLGRNTIIELTPEERQAFFDATAKVYEEASAIIPSEIIEKAIAIQENM